MIAIPGTSSQKGLDIKNIFDHPIPAGDRAGSTVSYRNVPVDLSSPRSNEKLVKLAEYGINGCSFYARQDGQNAPYYRSFISALPDIWLREGAAESLVRVNKILHPYQFELFALDGFRTIQMQAELWEYFIDIAKNTLANPSDEQCVRFAQDFCSNPGNFDPNDSRTWPAHHTGGSIDLTLRSLATGQEAFMGSVFDDGSELSTTIYFEDGLLTSASAIEARRNRRILFWAMTETGFANYANEWWHFDIYNQFWVSNLGSKDGAVASYGPASL
jgi:D-alanyl-D-alanine dipeptidase